MRVNAPDSARRWPAAHGHSDKIQGRYQNHMISAVIFSNTVWTFWDVFVLFFIVVPLAMLWFYAIFDVFRRRDISGVAKALWLLAIIIVPYLGVIFYFLFGDLAKSTAYQTS